MDSYKFLFKPTFSKANIYTFTVHIKIRKAYNLCGLVKQN